jgi:hypothetical protein
VAATPLPYPTAGGKPRCNVRLSASDFETFRVQFIKVLLQPFVKDGLRNSIFAVNKMSLQECEKNWSCVGGKQLPKRLIAQSLECCYLAG